MNITDLFGILLLFVILSIVVSGIARIIASLFSPKVRHAVAARPFLHVLWFITTVGIAVVGIAPVITGRTCTISPLVRQLSNLKQIGLGLRLYASDHDGKFPDKISDAFDFVPSGKVRQFTDPTTKQTHPWIYCPGHTDKDPEDTILVFSPPVTYNGRQERIVVHIDDSASFVDEPKFMSLLREQRQKKQQR